MVAWAALGVGDEHVHTIWIRSSGFSDVLD